MNDQKAIDALVTDLQWQIDQLGPRGVKNDAGRPFNPAYYKRGLQRALESGGLAVAEYVASYAHKPPSNGYKKLEDAGSLDLACEALIADEAKPYAHLFSDEDRAAARERLAPHAETIERQKTEHRARIDAARARIRREGMPRRHELDWQLRSRRS